MCLGTESHLGFGLHCSPRSRFQSHGNTQLCPPIPSPVLFGPLLSVCPHILSLSPMFSFTFSHSTLVSHSVPGQCCLSARYCSQGEGVWLGQGRSRPVWLEPRSEGGSRAQVTQHLRPGTTQRARGQSQRVASVNQVPCLCEGRDHPGPQALHGVPTGNPGAHRLDSGLSQKQS